MHSGTQANQANVEYFFRLIYECFRGACGTPDVSWFLALLAQIWLWIVIIGYLIAVIALFVIIYTTVRLFELRKREAEYYSTLIVADDKQKGGSSRWEHIESLIGGATPHEWRQAIIEADIMLDEVLAEHGYEGEGVGDKLKSASPTNFATLQDAWEAHKVRNQIAHQGSAFDLPQTLANRTIARFEAVFREFNAI